MHVSPKVFSRATVAIKEFETMSDTNAAELIKRSNFFVSQFMLSAGLKDEFSGHVMGLLKSTHSTAFTEGVKVEVENILSRATNHAMNEAKAFEYALKVVLIMEYGFTNITSQGIAAALWSLEGNKPFMFRLKDEFLAQLGY